MTTQEGLVSRPQVLRLGGDDDLIARQLRRRTWARVHRGVYVHHTGPLTQAQLHWAAVLYYWPAALCGETVLRLHALGTALTTGASPTPIHVAVDQERRVTRLPGTRLQRLTRLARFVQPNRAPARVRLEHAVLDVASARERVDDAVAVLSDAVQAGRTTPGRLLEALADRPKLRQRELLSTVLGDVAQGAYSALERRYLVRVERRHGLPTATRQRRVALGRGPGYRDVEYLGLGLVVELDGRLGHEWTRDRWDDLDRDVATAVSGGLTLRIGWRQVVEECRTAVAVARLLRIGGWTGRARPCSPSCPVDTTS